MAWNRWNEKESLGDLLGSFFFFFNELKGAKVVVFKKMSDSEVVTILTEKQGKIWGEKKFKGKNQPDLVIKRMGGGKWKDSQMIPGRGYVLSNSA